MRFGHSRIRDLAVAGVNPADQRRLLLARPFQAQIGEKFGVTGSRIT